MNESATTRQRTSLGPHRVIAALAATLAVLLGFAGTAQARPEPGPTPGVVPVSYSDIPQTAATAGSGWGLSTVVAVLAVAALVIGVAIIAQRAARHRRQIHAAA